MFEGALKMEHEDLDLLREQGQVTGTSQSYAVGRQS